jgi:hypothetical protein
MTPFVAAAFLLVVVGVPKILFAALSNAATCPLTAACALPGTPVHHACVVSAS